MTTLRKLPTSRPVTVTAMTKARGFAARYSNSAKAVSPRGGWPRRCGWRPCECHRLLDDFAHLEDGQIHGDDEAADDDAEEGHDHRLEQTAQAVDGVVHFLFVKIRHLREHGVARTRLLADGHHLHHHIGEEPGVAHAHLQRDSGRDLVAHAHDGVGVDDIARGRRHRGHGFHQRHTRREHGGERAGITGDSRLVDDVADDRDLQRQPVEEVIELGRALLAFDKGEDAAAYCQLLRPPKFLNEGRHIDDHLGHRGEIGAEALEQGYKLRHHEVQQDRGDDEGRDDHCARIEHGLLDLALDGLDLFLVEGDLVQQRLENTGLFAGAHEVAIELVEIARVLGQCLRQGAAALDVGLDAHDELLHAGIVVAAADDLEGLHQRHAGAHHGGELASEDGDVFGGDLFLLAAEQRFRLLFDLERIDALTAQLRPYQGDAASFDFTFGTGALSVGPFPNEDVLICGFLCHVTP